MNCGQGAAQSHSTCWFYAILNGLLMSEGGQKLLYEKMVHFYRGLTPTEKAFFKDGIDAPCPRGLAFKPIYFYKFLDQYFCFMSGPRGIKSKAGLSPQLLNNAGISPTITIHTGATSRDHFIPLLRRLGFTTDEYHVINNYSKILELLNKKTAIKSKIIYSDHYALSKPTQIKGYELICASIIIDLRSAYHDYEGHAVCGYMCNGHPYIVDSNFLDKKFPCKWWKYDELQKAFVKLNSNYNNIFTSIRVEYSMYARRSSLRRIHPACLLKYRNANAKAGTPAEQSATKRQDKRHRVLKFLFPRKKTQSLSPGVLPVPSSKSPVRTRSRGVGKPRKKVPYSRPYATK